MKGDYKFWYIKRDDSGKITEAAFRFYEGDVTTELEQQGILSEPQPVTRYRRTRKLKAEDLPADLKKKPKKDQGGADAFVFTPEDFGDISDDDELRAFMNREMKKDTTRDNIDEQVEEDVAKLKLLKLK